MFKSARIKLTLWYLLVIMLISAAFSAAIYKMLAVEVERFARTQRFRIEMRLNDQFLLPPGAAVVIEPELLAEAKKRIAMSLIVINISILVGSGFLGYFLAGKTLGPIEEMVEEQNRFVTDASHELRTPLTALKCGLEVYLREKRPKLAEAKRLAEDSLGEVNKLQKLADSLLRLITIHKPQIKTEKEKLEVNEIIDRAILRVEPMAKVKKIMIEKGNSEGQVEGDKDSLVDLLVILLDNAIKYSKDEGKVTVGSDQAEKEVMVKVKDEGIGIGEKDLPHIFDRFYRADSARSKSKSNGYGLGLAIAKKIVEEHRGLIRAESKIGEGSEFRVSLPLSVQPDFRNKT